MKNYLEELNSSMARHEQEKNAIRDQIRILQEKKIEDDKTKQDAITSGDNDAYLAAHRRIQDYEGQIKALQDLLAAKEKISYKADVIKALNNTINDFEASRGKALVKYKEAKRALAKLYADACHAEEELKRVRADYMQMANIDFYAGEVKDVSSFEPARREALTFLKDELSALGYDVEAIKTGRQRF